MKVEIYLNVQLFIDLTHNQEYQKIQFLGQIYLIEYMAEYDFMKGQKLKMLWLMQNWQQIKKMMPLLKEL